MDLHLWSLVTVMVLTGGFGGVINYFFSKEKDSTIWKSIIFGVGASFLVPLFLNMISSNLLETSKGDPYKTLVFMGFCLIAAISSKSFIGTISERVLKEAKEAKETAIEAKKQVQNVQEVLEPLANKETEQDYDEQASTYKAETIDIAAIDEKEKIILNALNNNKYTYRTGSGLAQELNMTRQTIFVSLVKLKSIGLVGQLTKPNNKVYWYLSEQGSKLIFNLEKGK